MTRRGVKAVLYASWMLVRNVMSAPDSTFFVVGHQSLTRSSLHCSDRRSGIRVGLEQHETVGEAEGMYETGSVSWMTM